MDTLLVLLKLWQMAKNKVSIRVFPSAFALCGGKPSNTQTNAKIFLCSFLTKFLLIIFGNLYCFMMLGKSMLQLIDLIYLLNDLRQFSVWQNELLCFL